MPLRQSVIAMRRRVLDGTLYDVLTTPFYAEKKDNGDYVPLRDRRPCVRTSLCRTVVDDAISLLFSEGHFPQIQHDNEAAKEALERIAKEANMNLVMIAGASSGSVGSAVFVMRILNKRVFFSAMDTDYLTPAWQPDAPDTLLSVTERYKVKGSALIDAGYTIAPDKSNVTYWYQRVWTDAQEQYFEPLEVGATDSLGNPALPVLDKVRTITHGLGFVPMVWVKNLPSLDLIDGMPTFPDEAIDTQIEIDYQLSQAGRGLKYSADPTLLLKEPAMGNNGQIIKGGGNAIVVNADGDAKMLEINGTATAAVLDYVKHLRELALETMHGNRTSAEKISAAQSGRAMELMNQGLIWLADRLRISYGEGALVELLKMVMRASEKIKLTFKDGSKVGNLDNSTPVSLRWPSWYAPTMSDLQSRANTLKTLCDAGLLSRETAIKILSVEYDIDDPAAEKLLADADMAERNAEATKQVAIAE